MSPLSSVVVGMAAHSWAIYASSRGYDYRGELARMRVEGSGVMDVLITSCGGVIGEVGLSMCGMVYEVEER